MRNTRLVWIQALGATLVLLLHPLLWLFERTLENKAFAAALFVHWLVMFPMALTRLRPPLVTSATPRSPERVIADLSGFKTQLAAPYHAGRNLLASLVAATLTAVGAFVTWWWAYAPTTSPDLIGPNGVFVGGASFLLTLLASTLLMSAWASWRTWRTTARVHRVGHVFRVDGASVVLTPDVPIHVELGGRLVVGPLVVEDDPAVLAWIANDLNAHRMAPDDPGNNEDIARLQAMTRRVTES